MELAIIHLKHRPTRMAHYILLHKLTVSHLALQGFLLQHPCFLILRHLSSSSGLTFQQIHASMLAYTTVEPTPSLIINILPDSSWGLGSENAWPPTSIAQTDLSRSLELASTNKNDASVLLCLEVKFPSILLPKSLSPLLSIAATTTATATAALLCSNGLQPYSTLEW